MIDMDRSARSDWPQEVESDMANRTLQGDPRMEEAVCHAQALANAARGISDAVASTRMPEVDRRSFNAQAETLYDQAVRLQNAARIADRQAMRAALADIDATCRSCHTRFRDVSGPAGSR
jgi:cytochrome c556